MADVTLPQLGETVTEGTITRWFKQVGDTVAADEPLFEVSTDKVDTEVPSPVAGTVTEIRAQEGDTVPVGAVIAVVGAADGAAAPPPAAPPAPAAGAAPEAGAASPASTPAGSSPPNVSTGPVSYEPSPADEANAPVEPAAAEQPATVSAPAADLRPEPEPAGAPSPSPSPAPAPAAGPAPSSPTSVAADAAALAGDHRLLSPVVRRLVAEHGLNPDDITGTGPGGRITRDDVLDHIDRVEGATAPAGAAAPSPAPAPASAASAPAAPPAPPAAAAAPSAPAPVPAVAAGDRDVSVKLSKIRKLTGSHMIASLATSAHAFSVVEVDFANVDAARKRVKESFKAAEGFSLTYLPFITRAVVDALVEFPHLNASVGPEDLVVHQYVDIGIAVDLEYQGLLVPVVRAAETKRLRALAREINDLANRARTRKLGPDEITGGTFTISNNGSAGSVLTQAIINQPQVAILSTDAIVRKPVVATLPDGGEAIVIHPVGHLSMSWDHRAFDGAYAAGFLVKVKQLLEQRDWSQEL